MKKEETACQRSITKTSSRSFLGFALLRANPAAHVVLCVLCLVACSLLTMTLGCQSTQQKNDSAHQPDQDSGPSPAAIKSSDSGRAETAPGWEAREPLEISRAAFDASNEIFEAHPTYLALNTPAKPVRGLLELVMARENLRLKSRGELHVTVISPPEFAQFSVVRMSMRNIEVVADKLQLEDADLDPLCLGMGQALVEGKLERTYFIVLRSENLVRIRAKILSEALAKANDGQRASLAQGFDPDHFYPHITVGYTREDLHEQQGVIKDRTSCLYPLKITP